MLGCAGLVAAHPGAVVVTVTAGRPGPHRLTDWDRRCGFAQDDDVVGTRRTEDREALAMLGARPFWLDFLDRQYGPSPAHGELVAAIGKAVAGAAIVASPLGLFHEDHVMTAAACFDVARKLSDVPWVLYEDAIYRPVPGRTEQALDALRGDGFALSEVRYPEAPAKRDAIARYPTQARGLGEQLADAFRPERYWRLDVK